jgi:DNA-binding transcriptional regulator LsrR (DeoR family)
MATFRRSERDVMAQKAAYLSAEHQWSQKQIAALLGGPSQTVVSRLLKYAEDKGWLERRVIFHGELLPESRLAELHRMVEPLGLTESLRALGTGSGVSLRNVCVVDSGGSGTTPRSIEGRLNRFGHRAAPHVAKLIERSDVFAVTWGSTVSHVIAGLETLNPPVELRHPIQFVPVCAEPTAQSSNKDTSSRLAPRLQFLTRSAGPSVNTPSLSGVPALIPRKFTDAEVRAIRKFIEQTASYKEIFGGPAPLISKVDSVLTSVGPSVRPMGFIHEELMRAGSTRTQPLTKARLSTLVAGDIAGVLLPKHGLDKAGLREVDELNRMWTGINRRHLARIARQADEKKRPGVIVVSFGADRAEIVAEVVRCGLVNELIVDRDLADRLAKNLSADRPSSAAPSR